MKRDVIRFPGIFLFLTAPIVAMENPRLDFALGVLAESRGDKREAVVRFESARAADSLALPLVRRVADSRLTDGDRPGAVKLYRELASARPDDLNIQVTYADFLEAQGGGDALALKLAGDTLDAALEKNPGHPQLIRRLFQRALAGGDQARQETLLNALSKEDTASVLLYASLSRSASDADDAAAREKLDQRFLFSVASHPESRELARTASDYFKDTDRPEQAIGILEKHIQAAPSSLELRTRLGILYISAKRDQEGEAALKEVLAIHPRQALAHQVLAKFYRLRDKPEAARFHASELLKIRGGSPADFMKLSDEWLAADDPRQARILLEKAVFDHPENPDLARRLAIATRRDPETRDQAARLFREAEAAGPVGENAEPDFLIESAEALIDQGQSKAAEERLRTAIKKFPPEAKKETAAALRRLARLWESESRNTDAARALRQRADALDR